METPASAPDAVEPESPDAADFAGLARRLIARLPAGKAATIAAGGMTWAALTGRAVAAPPPPPAFDQLLVRLVNRVCGYFLMDEYNLAQSLGYGAYLSHHLSPSPAQDTALNNYIAAEPGLQVMTSPATTPAMLAAVDGSGYIPGQVLEHLTLVRRTLSKWRLYERMVEFADDHLNIDVRAKSLGIVKPLDDRDVIRPHALGCFADLLWASAHSPAMLVYLDNFDNQTPNFQENYARELLELHTLGVNNGYGEQDVKDLAKCLAGLSINKVLHTPTTFQYLHVPAFHGTPQVFTLLAQSGQTITVPAGTAEQQADVVLSGLAFHPNTEQFLAKKLVRWLVTYADTPALRTVAVDAYQASGGGLAQVVEGLLAQSILQAVNAQGTLLMKRPVQHAVGLLAQVKAIVRQSQSATQNPGLTTLPMAALLAELRRSGHTPHEWGTPDGPAHSETVWASGVDARWRMASKIMSCPETELCGAQPCANELPGINVDNATLAGILGAFDVSQTAQRLNEVLTGGNLTAFEVAAIQTYVDAAVQLLLGGQITDPFQIVREAIALAASAPSYQYY